MTSTDVAVREERPLATVLTNEQLAYIANTEFVPKGLRGNLPAILACVATGRAIGIDDMSAIRSIHIIDGKATFSAELMVMLVRRAGHSITGEIGEGSATVTGTRVDNGDTMTVTWTLDMARRAGLANKSNWKSYPESMCWARAVSQLCRMLFADCFAGSTYTTEELGEEHTDSDGEPRGADDASDATQSPVGSPDASSSADGDGGGRGVSEAAAAPTNPDHAALVAEVQAGIDRLSPTDPGWTLEATLESAGRSFGRPVAGLAELSVAELRQIVAVMPPDPLPFT